MGCGCSRRMVSSASEAVPAPQVAQANLNAGTVTPMALDQVAPVVKSSGYNILDVLQDKLTGKIKYVPKDVSEFRLGQCHSCEHLKIGLCTQCGCIVEFKTRYEESSCPLGKW